MMLPSLTLAVGILIVGAILVVSRGSGSYLVINPIYFERLKNASLSAPEAFLKLPAVIVSGHPDRNVARVTIDTGSEKLEGFLKREHRVRLKERLLNALAGFGFVSKSHREALTLERAEEAGVPCPNWVAYGRCHSGQAFLLIEKLAETVDLRVWAENTMRPGDDKRTLAKAIGRKLAQVHNAGFDHPDLYAKHVLVNEQSGEFHILDWQRSGRKHGVGWKQRFRDLAALHATLPEGTFLPRDRLACLFAYIQDARSGCDQPIPKLSLAIAEIKQEAAHLMKRRHVHQPRTVGIAQPAQNVIWLRGEELCVTPAFHEVSQNANPEFLTSLMYAEGKPGIDSKVVVLSESRAVVLSRRQESRPLSLFLTRLLGRRWTSPEVRQAGLIFRLQRFGIKTPRLLAFGQAQRFPGKLRSFLLTEPDRDAISFSQKIREHTPSANQNRLVDCRALICEAGRLLGQIHESGCRFKDAIDGGLDLVVQGPSIGLGRIDNVVVKRGKGGAHFRADMGGLVECLLPVIGNKSDLIRFIRAYQGLPELNGEGRTLYRYLLRHSSRGVFKPIFRRGFELIYRSPLVSPIRMAWRGSP
jgi:hypothetical protein